MLEAPIAMNANSFSLPCFIPASRAQKTEPSENNIFSEDQLDFDLLAEYLLEDSVGVANTGFDFNIESPPVTEQQQPAVSVTPDTNFENFQDSTINISVTTNNWKAKDEPKRASTTQGTITSNQSLIAPAPSSLPSSLPTMPLSIKPPSPQLVPMPTQTSSVPAQTMVLHQHKRPRTDAGTQQQIQAPSTSNATTNQLLPGNNTILPQILAPRGGRQKSQAQIDRRRERNRILARRTRLRKKFFFESLQKDVIDLQKENMALKEVVRTRIKADEAKKILGSCNATEKLPSIVLEHCGCPTDLAQKDFNLVNSVQKSQQCFVITDPSLQDNPIVYASNDFLTLTGYSREQVLGRNCRFMQGTDTDPTKVAKIRKALSSGDDASVTFINYTADGTAFWNKLFIAALRDAQNNIVNYIGVVVQVARPDSDDPESGKALPGENSSTGDQNAATNSDSAVDADATVMAIESAVTAAVAAAPIVVKTNP